MKLLAVVLLLVATIPALNSMVSCNTIAQAGYTHSIHAMDMKRQEYASCRRGWQGSVLIFIELTRPAQLVI